MGCIKLYLGIISPYMEDIRSQERPSPLYYQQQHIMLFNYFLFLKLKGKKDMKNESKMNPNNKLRKNSFCVKEILNSVVLKVTFIQLLTLCNTLL